MFSLGDFSSLPRDQRRRNFELNIFSEGEEATVAFDEGLIRTQKSNILSVCIVQLLVLFENGVNLEVVGLDKRR